MSRYRVPVSVMSSGRREETPMPVRTSAATVSAGGSGTKNRTAEQTAAAAKSHCDHEEQPHPAREEAEQHAARRDSSQEEHETDVRRHQVVAAKST